MEKIYIFQFFKLKSKSIIESLSLFLKTIHIIYTLKKKNIELNLNYLHNLI